MQQIPALARRAFGKDTEVLEVVELSGGLYNSTYRVHLRGHPPRVLRVAPEPAKQARIERELMRNEHAALPHFAPIAELMPRTLFVDWTRDLVDRDYVWQTLVEGAPARTFSPLPDAFYRQLGEITKKVHEVRGTHFGPVAGPTFGTWSEALLSGFEDLVADVRDAGLDATDLRELITVVAADRAVLDEIDQPRLLHGDLWIPNLLVSPTAEITGVLDHDHDHASWGDPKADWTLHVAKHPSFHEGYASAPTPALVEQRWRESVYRTRHVGAVRLERHRLGKHAKLPANYEDMREILTALPLAPH